MLANITNNIATTMAAIPNDISDITPVDVFQLIRGLGQLKDEWPAEFVWGFIYGTTVHDVPLSYEEEIVGTFDPYTGTYSGGCYQKNGADEFNLDVSQWFYSFDAPYAGSVFAAGLLPFARIGLRGCPKEIRQYLQTTAKQVRAWTLTENNIQLAIDNYLTNKADCDVFFQNMKYSWNTKDVNNAGMFFGYLFNEIILGQPI